MTQKKTHVPESSPRILVVDDDEDIASTLAEAFRLASCVVETAGSGRAAAAMIAARRFDVVLTDIRMPDGGGIELLDWLARTKQDISPFVMTGFGDASMEQALRSGALGFFSKPFEVGLIVSTILAKIGAKT